MAAYWFWPKFLAGKATHDFGPLCSMVCRHEHFHQEWFARWASEVLGHPAPEDKHHRKFWEWAAIAQALHERGQLAAGRRGLGFAVGLEPLPSLFAKYGAKIEATDIVSTDESSTGWQNTNQHAANHEAIYKEYIIDRATFDSHVTFHPADMRDLTEFTPSSYDFIWSSCSFEHLGDLSLGMTFVRKSSKLLKPGGVAVHTTEFNCYSDDKTVEKGNDVIYRRSDLTRLASELRADGFRVAPLDFNLGTDKEDRVPDVVPYDHTTGRHHVKLHMLGFVATSIMLIIERP